MSSYVPQKIDLTPKRHHGYAVLLFIMGTLFPPLAVAARFGIGKDFWLNLLLTVCGYIPGHGHNFYIQNIRNNKTHARTPKWAQRYGLIDTSEIKRKERKSQWANRYNDRLPESTYDGQPLEEGQEAGSSVDLSVDAHGSRAQRQPNGDLWNPEDEQFYNADRNASRSSSGGSRWHYPANFDDVEPMSPPSKKSKKKKKDKKDRWARTEDAYSMTEEQQGKRKKSKRKKARDSTANVSTYSADTGTEFPEDAEGGLYGERRTAAPGPEGSAPKNQERTTDDVFSHQF
ncbi:hypothetical protein HGRIS_013059 [Hohenbuehelia grisea]|uniref:Uncharacterized protein n=1 Tax=Hohenbuehelia grisea TaxID=104357 RepID=A0ABR3IU90_9AGAR